MSLNNLKNKESLSFNPNNFGNNLGLTPVRVFSVILDNTHPKYTGEDSIGTIFYGKVSRSENSISLDNLSKAKPSFSFVKQYPLVNEIVLVFNSTTNNIYSDTKGDNVFTSTYYFPNLNVWNNSQHNALPLERDLKNQENSQEASVGIQQNNVQKSNIKLGEYFVEKEILKSLQPFEGDVIFEGRFGQGLRFGSSNPRGKNNWSENDSLGAPITVLSNGHNQASGDTILEDINNTDSVIVMTSEHNINNLEVASNNLQSLNTTFEQSTGTQVLIDDTPVETIEAAPQEETEEIEFTEITGSIEETIIQESPPVSSSASPFNDPLFALLDEEEVNYEEYEWTDENAGEDIYLNEDFEIDYDFNANIGGGGVTPGEIQNGQLNFDDLKDGQLFTNSGYTFGRYNIKLSTACRTTNNKFESGQNWPGHDYVAGNETSTSFTAKSIMSNLNGLILNCIDPLLDHYGEYQKSNGVASGLHINCMYRATPYNTDVNGELNSQHRVGQACDFQVVNVSVATIFNYIVNSGIPYDQLIAERGDRGVFGRPKAKGQSSKRGWIHISFKNPNSKGEDRNRYKRTLFTSGGNSDYMKAIIQEYPDGTQRKKGYFDIAVGKDKISKNLREPDILLEAAGYSPTGYARN